MGQYRGPGGQPRGLRAALAPAGPGIRQVDRYDELDLVASWRSYLDAPDRYLRHLLTD